MEARGGSETSQGDRKRYLSNNRRSGVENGRTRGQSTLAHYNFQKPVKKLSIKKNALTKKKFASRDSPAPETPRRLADYKIRYAPGLVQAADGRSDLLVIGFDTTAYTATHDWRGCSHVRRSHVGRNCFHNRTGDVSLFSWKLA